jgi:signal transduction histidine kinase/DNA-binding NarL/FixJ family response regulator/HPt (histidine-containing phosphotransfer) domain-containing protein
MLKMRNFFNKVNPKRPLYIQILFTIFAFSIMIIISYAFMKKIIHDYLLQNTESTLDSVQKQITSDLLEPQTVLDNVSQITRAMILRGDDAGKLHDYLTIMLDNLFLDNHRNAVYSTLFGYFETLPGGPAFIEGLIREMEEWYNPTERSWYQNAVKANGEIARTIIYGDSIYDEPVLIFSRCIFDDKGRRLGALGIRIQIDAIGKYVINTTKTQGGYGVLMSEDLVIFAHPNQDYTGKNIRDLKITLSELADDLQNRTDIFERPMVSFKNEAAIAFFREIPNGWYMGIVVPKKLYYQKATYMVTILNILGIVLACVLIFVLIRVDAARNKADMESRHKSAFLANVSHEIRTPMNAIIGMTEILQNEPINERQMGFVNDIKASSHSLLSLINDILDLSKIESGKLELNPVNYDFHALLENIISMFSYVAQKKGLEFIFEEEGEIPNYLYGDDIRLKQILTNICGNAVKYTEKGQIKIKITATDNNLMFEIKDTGMGIRKEDIPKLFNTFQRLEAEKSRTIVGTGLGLSISRSFVEMMGGKIIVDSEYEQGSVFLVIIPIVLGNKEEVKIKRNSEAEHTLYAPGARVLVVDDNEFNLRVAEGLLGLFGINAQTAFSGREAIDLVKNNEYDIVFMDHMMPEMDGIEATDEIRELGGKYKKLPIIALTANAIQGAKEMFLDSGFNGFISKPIDIQELNEILREWLPPEIIKEKKKEKKEPERKANSDFMNAVNKIGEINTEIGMDRVSHMEDMYRETLELFYNKIIPDCESMSAKIDNGNIKMFSISVHAMKSVLATIGAMSLSETALRLETASKNNDIEYCVQRFPAFRDKLFNLHKELSVIFQGAVTVNKKKSGDTAYLRENINKALAAAFDFDGITGLKIINDLLAYDFGEQNNALLENIASSFRIFNFKTVTELLNKIKAGI